MHFLFDNLLAVTVAAVLVFILAILGGRQQAESVMLAERHIGAGREAALSDWLQSDLQSLAAVTVRTNSRLVFTRSVNPATAQTAEVEYTLVCEPSAPDRCEVVRREGGVDQTVSPAVASFSVTLLAATGQPTTVPSLTSTLRVRVVTAPEFTGGTASVWERTFTPSMLGRTTV